MTLQIKMTSVMVDEQEKALRFYTEVLGFVKKTDMPMGEHRFLTVVAADGSPGAELLLEPMAFAPAKTFQRALFDAGIPATAFVVDDIAKDHARLKAHGVRFVQEPLHSEAAGITVAVLDDTCGNLIQLVQV